MYVDQVGSSSIHVVYIYLQTDMRSNNAVTIPGLTSHFGHLSETLNRMC